MSCSDGCTLPLPTCRTHPCQEALGVAESKLASAVKAKNTALQTVDDLTKQLSQRDKEREDSSTPGAGSAPTLTDASALDDTGSGRDLMAEFILVGGVGPIGGRRGVD